MGYSSNNPNVSDAEKMSECTPARAHSRPPENTCTARKTPRNARIRPPRTPNPPTARPWGPPTRSRYRWSQSSLRPRASTYMRFGPDRKFRPPRPRPQPRPPTRLLPTAGDIGLRSESARMCAHSGSDSPSFATTPLREAGGGGGGVCVVFGCCGLGFHSRRVARARCAQ